MVEQRSGIVKNEGDMIELQNQIKSPIIKVEKKSLWRRLLRMPIRKTVTFIWNLLMMFQVVLPLNITSRIWGWINALNLPVWSRIPIYQLYSWLYRCNLDEMVEPNLRTYSNLSEFFRRSLKPECRPIDNKASLTSPVDGKVVSLGSVHAGQLQNVKGINYTLKGFLGPASWMESANLQFTTVLEREYRSIKSSDRNRSAVPDGENATFIDELKHGVTTKLFHCIIYLAPGDYHKFHSPADWMLIFRRHFPGKLFSVNPLFTSWIKNLFCLNERSVYVGSWRYGFFSFTAVGANNVGSISVSCDPLLQTNKPTSRLLRGVIQGWHFISRSKSSTAPKLQQRYYDHRFLSKSGPHGLQNVSSGVPVSKGDLFGEFNFGSTVVLIFEAPSNFQFEVELNSLVKVGQALGRVIHP